MSRKYVVVITLGMEKLYEERYLSLGGLHAIGNSLLLANKYGTKTMANRAVKFYLQKKVTYDFEVISAIPVKVRTNAMFTSSGDEILAIQVKQLIGGKLV